MIGTGPIQKRKLSDEVRDRLLDMIRSGSLAPGDSLPSERELMDSLSVGRPAIREALQALEHSGLIEIRHGERARVATPSIGRMMDQMAETMNHVLSHSPASLEHLKEARITFEREMVRTAAKKAKAADIARLEATLAEQRAALPDIPRFRALDGRFHREIAEISGNPIWSALSDALFAWLKDFHRDLIAAPGLEDLTLSEHRQILDAIRDKEPKKAARAMEDHLSRANELYRKAGAK